MALSLLANFDKSVDPESHLKFIDAGNADSNSNSIAFNRIQVSFDDSKKEVYRYCDTPH